MVSERYSITGSYARITINVAQELSDAGIREAIGMQAPNLDTQLSEINTNVDKLDEFWPGNDGSVSVDQDYGGAGNLTYTLNGNPVSGASIRAYLASDYNASRRGADYVVASATQKADGDWSNPLLLDPGQYKLLFYLRDVAGPDTFDLTVE